MPMTSGPLGPVRGAILESALDGCLIMFIRVGRGFDSNRAQEVRRP
jgi:hypothetical protein